MASVSRCVSTCVFLQSVAVPRRSFDPTSNRNSEHEHQRVARVPEGYFGKVSFFDQSNLPRSGRSATLDRPAMNDLASFRTISRWRWWVAGAPARRKKTNVSSLAGLRAGGKDFFEKEEGLIFGRRRATPLYPSASASDLYTLGDKVLTLRYKV
jgi:hypothetical protein